MLRRRLVAAVSVALVATALGAWRLEQLDAGAAEFEAGRVAIAGTVAVGPRRFGDGALFTLDTNAGRIAVRTGPRAEPVAAGDHVLVRGEAIHAEDWIAGYLRRLGTRAWIAARRVVIAGKPRGGVLGLLDETRNRAAAAIDAVMPEREAALMRGFVLGDDSRIDPATTEDFKASGLAHLLAVSGQNVILLLAFCTAVLIALGVRLRFRWPILAAAVALYVPVAGAGPSIQRAGIMGLLGLMAASLERPAERWWCIYLAAATTLAWNPLAIGDAGWQLSFAAVAGIAAGARPLATALRRKLGRVPNGAIRSGLAEGVAITLAATLATAPLMAHHFEQVSLAAVPANLLALPAVAPAMWTGMAIALAGQIPQLPLDPLGMLAGWLVGYVEWVANLTAKPSWALADLKLGSWWLVGLTYLLIGSLPIWGRALGGRLAAFTPRPGLRRTTPWQRRSGVLAGLAGAIGLALFLVAVPAAQRPKSAEIRDWRFETRFLDVGQGDAILLRERQGAAVLVDTGYSGTGAEDRLAELGVERLDGVVLTHADLDHVGNIEAIAARLEIGAVYTNGLDRRLGVRLRALGLRERAIAAGDRLRFGRIRLDVIWPPPAAGGLSDEPNDAAIVAVAGWRGFSALLSSDAEAEAANYPVVDVDVLKVPHHGSADAGLSELLAASRPELAVISVGEKNGYGHPSAESVGAIARAGVPLRRTDTGGELRVTVGDRAWVAG